jgi:hypothetical protein
MASIQSRRTVLKAAALAGTAAAATFVGSGRQLWAQDRSAAQEDPFPATRDVFTWPFARDSIWNMPIGSAAQYHHAGFRPYNPADPLAIEDHHTAPNGYNIEHEVICLQPGAPLTDVWWNPGTFDPEPGRCNRLPDPDTGELRRLDRIPIPAGWVFTEGAPANSTRINACFVGIRPPDSSGVTKELVGLFAFARCGAGSYATARLVSSSTTGTWQRSWRLTGSDIYGEGRFGEHGGTHLSVLGGALRLGELRPGGGRIRHALKIVLPQRLQWHAPDGVDNWVWPAFNGDRNSGNHGSDPHVVQGALYAIPPSIDLDELGLETEPGQQIAWTIQNYGAYNVDTTPKQNCALGVEVGPAGDFREQFLDDWGFPIWRKAHTPPNILRLRQDFVWEDGTNTGPWLRDLDRIFSSLHVVTNNGPDSIGGGGTPRQPLAPPFA